MNLDQYLPADHEFHAVSLRDSYFEAQSELITDYPSTPFTRFKTLQAMTGGLRSNEFTILCGGTGTGKTTLCANWSADFLSQGVSQFVASVETGRNDYVKRMISAVSEQDWNSGERVELDMLRVFNDQHQRTFQSDTLQLSKYEDRTSVEMLMRDLAYAVRHHGAKVAIIDNLNFFMEVTSASNSIVEMDRVIHELIIFCKKVPIHIVMVMHPRKTEGRVESEFDIKGSSTAVQEAHNIFLFNRAHPELIEAGIAIAWDREIMIAKMRRRGKFVRRRLLIRAKNGVHYFEGDLV